MKTPSEKPNLAAQDALRIVEDTILELRKDELSPNLAAQLDELEEALRTNDLDKLKQFSRQTEGADVWYSVGIYLDALETGELQIFRTE